MNLDDKKSQTSVKKSQNTPHSVKKTQKYKFR